MRTRIGKFGWLLGALCVATLVALLLYTMVMRRAVLELDLETDTRTILKVYWPTDDGRYTERRMAMLVIKPGQSHYRLRICDLEGIKNLRLDPSERPARVTIHSLAIYQEGFPPVHFDGRKGLSRLVPLGGIRNLLEEEGGVTVIPDGLDPQLAVPLPEMTRGPTFLVDSARIAAILALVLLFSWGVRSLIQRYQYVGYLLVFVLALIVVMASISEVNHHPDEYVHINAAGYYENHFLPPKIESPSILHTYSVYGVSRLHSGEVVYLIAGKFLQLTKPLHLPAYLVLRFFNVGLFLFLVICALRSEAFRVFLAPLLISPQIWYVFSYFDSDAFALFVLLLGGYQIAVRDSLFNRFLDDGLQAKNVWVAAGMGLLFALLFMVKKNFYFFPLFLFLYFFWRIRFGEWTLTRTLVLRLGMVLLLACSLAGLYRGVEYKINGFDRAEKLVQAREHLADRMYKPSTPLAKKHPYLQMKERGVTLKQFLQQDRWGEKSFRSSFGVYDYLSLSGPFSYYDMVRVLGLVLLLATVVPVIIRGGGAGISLTILTLSVSCALLVVAMYHAWTVDFQAQGRYFLPIIGICSVWFYHVERYLYRPLFQLLLFAIYLFGLYSFIFIGLYGIAKYSV